ncbi:MAG: hypothetical protein C0504_05865 [Candidatus Solibacter sp.]|nr:hypothetical protein [Candidatus Solibacter sp.]
MKDERFDEILDAMREETATPAELKEARERVWRRMMSGSVCAGFRAQFEDYRGGSLTGDRQILMADHLSRCAECRKAMDELEGRRNVIEMPAAPRRKWLPEGQWRRWAVAAGLAAIALFASRDRIDSALAPSGPRATVAALNGGLFTVAGRPVSAGAPLAESEAVRTAAGARAVLRLADGSTVEMNERTELAVKAAWSGQTIRLSRGDVIVTAARQRRGGLHVVTNDTEATVKGTIFTVRAGLAGSMVGVVEGSVEVSQPGREALLKAGERASTNPAMDRLQVRDAVAWSGDADKYFALLAELATLEKRLAGLPEPAPRTEAKLLRHLPSGSVSYAAMPNLGGTAGQAIAMIENRAHESAALKQWWDSPQGEAARKLMKHVQDISPMLGDEIVFILVKDAADAAGKTTPLILAHVAAGRQADLQQAIARIVPENGAALPYVINGTLLAASESTESLAVLQAKLGAGANSPFAAQIAARYARGVSWMFALDVAGFNQSWAEGTAVTVAGIERVNYLFFEQKQVNGAGEVKASIGFKSARTGVASWLGEPGASGSAEYASAEAFMALSASTKNPRQAFDELVDLISRADPKFAAELDRFEAETGVNVAGGLASALGSDFTFIVETPRIPIPGWAVAMEVYGPDSIDAAAGRFVQAFNAKLPAGQQQFKMTLTKTESGGRTWHTLASAAAKSPLMWTYDRGYMIVTMDRSIGERAIAARASGYPLVRSAAFRAQMPGLGAVHHSGFLWINTKGALSELSGLTSNPALRQLLEYRDPVLVVFDGSTERIEAASRTRLTSLVFDVLLAAGAANPEAKAPKTN